MGYNVIFNSLGHSGQPLPYFMEEKDNTFVGRITQGSDFYSTSRFVKTVKPDIVISLRDAWIYCGPPYFANKYDARKLYEMNPDIRHIIYSPIQNDHVPNEYTKAFIENCHMGITMTNWARDALIKNGFDPERIEVVEHGYDPKLYYHETLEKKKYGYPEERPVITFIGMNLDYRKNYPTLMAAFAKVRKVIPSYLYIHTEPLGYYNLFQHEYLAGIGEDTMYPRDHLKYWGIPEDKMKDLYNLTDVYVNPSYSEGFGIPEMQATVCGTPTVLTDFPNHRELFGKYAWYPKTARDHPTVWGYEWRVEANSMADKIIEILKMPEDELKEWRKRALIHFKRLEWRYIYNKLDRIIKKTLDLPPELPKAPKMRTILDDKNE